MTDLHSNIFIKHASHCYLQHSLFPVPVSIAEKFHQILMLFHLI